MTVSKVITDVLVERASQDRQWGGPEHDDTHAHGDWVSYIQYQMHRMMLDPTISVATIRERYIKIAALAVAAVESMDRRASDERTP